MVRQQPDDSDGSVYAIGRAGIVQFIEMLGETIADDCDLDETAAAGIPAMLVRAQRDFLRTWDRVCGVRQ